MVMCSRCGDRVLPTAAVECPLYHRPKRLLIFINKTVIRPESIHSSQLSLRKDGRQNSHSVWPINGWGNRGGRGIIRREVDLTPIASRIVQDAQRDRIWVRNDLIPRWDRVRQCSKLVSVETVIFTGEVVLWDGSQVDLVKSRNPRHPPGPWQK